MKILYAVVMIPTLCGATSTCWSQGPPQQPHKDMSDWQHLVGVADAHVNHGEVLTDGGPLDDGTHVDIGINDWSQIVLGMDLPEGHPLYTYAPPVYQHLIDAAEIKDSLYGTPEPNYTEGGFNVGMGHFAMGEFDLSDIAWWLCWQQVIAMGDHLDEAHEDHDLAWVVLIDFVQNGTVPPPHPDADQ